MISLFKSKEKISLENKLYELYNLYKNTKDNIDYIVNFIEQNQKYFLSSNFRQDLIEIIKTDSIKDNVFLGIILYKLSEINEENINNFENHTLKTRKHLLSILGKKDTELSNEKLLKEIKLKLKETENKYKDKIKELENTNKNLNFLNNVFFKKIKEYSDIQKLLAINNIGGNIFEEIKKLIDIKNKFGNVIKELIKKQIIIKVNNGGYVINPNIIRFIEEEKNKKSKTKKTPYYEETKITTTTSSSVIRNPNSGEHKIEKFTYLELDEFKAEHKVEYKSEAKNSDKKTKNKPKKKKEKKVGKKTGKNKGNEKISKSNTTNKKNNSGETIDKAKIQEAIKKYEEWSEE